MYGELRMDLPGDQQQKVAQFLSKFPGFADQSTLGTKIDEALDKFIAQASHDKQSYTKDIKPWFGGELAFSVGDLPDPKTATGSSGMPDIHGLALISIKDGVLAKAWFDKTLAETGAKTTTETYGGTTITESTADHQAAGFAIIGDKVAVIGDLTSVKAAIDTKGAGAFAGEADPKVALAAAPSNHLALVYVAVTPFIEWTNAMGAGGAGTAGLSDAMTKYLPKWESFWVRSEGDALVMAAALPKTAAQTGSTSNGTADVLKHVPSNAIVSVTTGDLGKGLLSAWSLYKSEPSMKTVTDQIEKAADLAGGIDAIVGWMGDTAIVVDRTDTSAEGGVIIVPTDAANARHLLTSLKSAIGLAGDQAGVTIREEDHGGVTITIVDAGDIAKLAGSMGQLPPGFQLPSGHIELAWAVTDQIVVVGSGPDFVKHVLDTTEATSLGANARYKALADRAGSGSAAYFVDIAAIRAMSEGFAKGIGTDLGTYDSDIKPFIAPFDALYVSASTDGDLVHSSFYLTVK
jgi:hypothetical protein